MLPTGLTGCPIDLGFADSVSRRIWCFGGSDVVWQEFTFAKSVLSDFHSLERLSASCNATPSAECGFLPICPHTLSYKSEGAHESSFSHVFARHVVQWTQADLSRCTMDGSLESFASGYQNLHYWLERQGLHSEHWPSAAAYALTDFAEQPIRCTLPLPACDVSRAVCNNRRVTPASRKCGKSPSMDTQSSTILHLVCRRMRPTTSRLPRRRPLPSDHTHTRTLAVRRPAFFRP